MKFMMMMHAPKGDGDWQVSSWAPADLEAHIAFMQRLNEEITATGEFVDGQGLAGPGEAKIVRATAGGAPAVTDGPFPEAKEFLAGYWIVDVDRPERAYELAARTSSAPGPGGSPLIIPIEVRQVMQAPPTDA